MGGLHSRRGLRAQWSGILYINQLNNMMCCPPNRTIYPSRLKKRPKCFPKELFVHIEEEHITFGAENDFAPTKLVFRLWKMGTTRPLQSNEIAQTVQLSQQIASVLLTQGITLETDCGYWFRSSKRRKKVLTSIFLEGFNFESIEKDRPSRSLRVV